MYYIFIIIIIIIIIMHNSNDHIYNECLARYHKMNIYLKYQNYVLFYMITTIKHWAKTTL
jgi:hypothetical protein